MSSSNPGPATTTGSNTLGGGSPMLVGASATSLVGFYGTTPVAQTSGAAQAAVTDASGGAAAATNGILTITGTYNATIIANALATLAAQGNAMQSALAGMGLMKGSA